MQESKEEHNVLEHPSVLSDKVAQWLVLLSQRQLVAGWIPERCSSTYCYILFYRKVEKNSHVEIQAARSHTAAQWFMLRSHRQLVAGWIFDCSCKVFMQLYTFTGK